MSENQAPDPVLQLQFVTAYSEAVLRFLKDDAPQEVLWDSKTDSFKSAPLEEGTSPMDVALYIGSTWSEWIQDDAIAIPEDLNVVEAVAFRSEIERHLMSSAYLPSMIRVCIQDAAEGSA